MAEAPRLDRDGDTVMGGVNAASTATDVAAQISALESRLTSRIAAHQGNTPDTRAYPPAVSMDVRRQRLAGGYCER
ncbi:hypothetical protein E4U28_007089 [Claviceps purpurea]|nr:hypothetical protein E4U28_007089 [Claviceps purpurea]